MGDFRTRCPHARACPGGFARRLSNRVRSRFRPADRRRCRSDALLKRTVGTRSEPEVILPEKFARSVSLLLQHRAGPSGILHSSVRRGAGGMISPSGQLSALALSGAVFRLLQICGNRDTVAGLPCRTGTTGFIPVRQDGRSIRFADAQAPLDINPPRSATVRGTLPPAAASSRWFRRRDGADRWSAPSFGSGPHRLSW